jgi:hypothetical protein
MDEDTTDEEQDGVTNKMGMGPFLRSAHPDLLLRIEKEAFWTSAGRLKGMTGSEAHADAKKARREERALKEVATSAMDISEENSGPRIKQTYNKVANSPHPRRPLVSTVCGRWPGHVMDQLTSSDSDSYSD